MYFSFGLFVIIYSSFIIILEFDGIQAFLNPEANSVISPYSIYSTLLPLKLGSGGATRVELEKALERLDFGNSQVSQTRNPKSYAQSFMKIQVFSHPMPSTTIHV